MALEVNSLSLDSVTEGINPPEENMLQAPPVHINSSLPLNGPAVFGYHQAYTLPDIAEKMALEVNSLSLDGVTEGINPPEENMLQAPPVHIISSLRLNSPVFGYHEADPLPDIAESMAENICC